MMKWFNSWRRVAVIRHYPPPIAAIRRLCLGSRGRGTTAIEEENDDEDEEPKAKAENRTTRERPTRGLCQLVGFAEKLQSGFSFGWFRVSSGNANLRRPVSIWTWLFFSNASDYV